MHTNALERRVGYALLALSISLLAVGLNWSGIWDPWEIDVAEVARSWSEGRPASVDGSPLGPWLSSLSFNWLGVREWTGRLPVALAGMLTLGLVYWLGRLGGAHGVGALAALVCATTPLFLINSRLMLGASPHFLLQALVGLACAHSVFVEHASPTRRWLSTALALLAVGLSTWASGGLLGPLPPLLGFAVATLLDPVQRRRLDAVVPLWLVTAALAYLVWGAIRADAPEYSVWLGGGARGGQPPSFEREVERLFHNFAPWSALLIPALGVLLARMSAAGDDPDDGTDAAGETGADPGSPSPAVMGGLFGATPTPPRPGFAVFLLVWFAASYAVTSLFASRYGSVPVYAVAPLAVAVALTLTELHREGRAEWLLAVLGVLFVALLLRDYAKFPGSPISGAPGVRPTVPETGFSATTGWTVVCCVFALGTAMTFLAAEPWPVPTRETMRTFVLTQWKRGPGHRFWWVLIAALGVGILVAGVVMFIVPGQFNSLAVRVGRYLLLLPPLLLAVLFMMPRAFNLLGRRPHLRLIPVALGGLAFGGYFAFGFVPSLSQHLSPREVFETYNTLRSNDEPLGEYQVGGRAGAYYTDGEVQPLRDVNGIVRFLGGAGESRVWTVFPADQLVSVNQQYRRQSGAHLYVADARNARILLATNQPVAGRPNQNPLATTVLQSLPREPQHVLRANFDDKVELIGYDIELPGGTTVGPSQSFAITWYWRALTPTAGSYRIFLHIDGHGQRLNGDHDAVDGLYPVANWQPGDIVLDRQELEVAANYPPGDQYNIWLGLFSGNQRLALREAPVCSSRQRTNCKDDTNRLNAGTLEVR